jgi:hypothetical protein
MVACSNNTLWEANEIFWPMSNRPLKAVYVCTASTAVFCVLVDVGRVAAGRGITWTG